MDFFDFLRNRTNALFGRNQEFEQLLQAKDISAVKGMMCNQMDKTAEALKEYNIRTHKVMSRPDKIVVNKDGEVTRVESVWRLPIDYPTYINEISLVFLYGEPVKWTQGSDKGDKAFAKFMDVLKETRFDSKIRQCKRIAGAETISAMLFRVFKDEDNKPDVQIRVLVPSEGDEIYYRFDQYKQLITFAWGYYVREEQNQVVYHFDVYTKDKTYRCKQGKLGWDVDVEPNFIGKIPVILFRQEKEWKGVEALIERQEAILSKNADRNDYFCNPILVISTDAVKSLPDKGESGKVVVVKNNASIDDAAKYLTWDSAPQAQKDEMDILDMHILNKTFTPSITLDTLKNVSQLSAKALRTVMMLADIKAAKHKESHDEMLDRIASLLLTIIGNVLDVSLKSECEELVINHEFQNPFGEDIQETITQLISAKDAGIMSEETAIENNPLVDDTVQEKERIRAEREERMKEEMSVFNDTMGGGPQSYNDGSDKPKKTKNESSDK